MSNFKEFIKSHDPQEKWNFDDPETLEKQFVKVVTESGSFDVKGLFKLLFPVYEPGLTEKQNERFLK